MPVYRARHPHLRTGWVFESRRSIAAVVIGVPLGALDDEPPRILTLHATRHLAVAEAVARIRGTNGRLKMRDVHVVEVEQIG